MKVYRISEVLEAVRVALDENMVSKPLTDLGDIDTLSLNDIIRSKIVEAVRQVHASAPSYLLDGGYHLDSVQWNSDNRSGWILLPEDFMRLIVFQMSDWNRPVYYAINEDDEQYALQSSRFKGIKGTPQKPVCVIGIRTEGRVMEFYSSKSNSATILRGLYMPYPIIESDDNGEYIYICERCFDAVKYAIASLAVTAYGQGDKASLLTELSKSALV